MKPFSLIAEYAPSRAPVRTEKPRLERVWIKVEGKLECRWVDASLRR